MKLEQQVVSLELAKKLKELGVKQESYFLWGTQIGETSLWSKEWIGIDVKPKDLYSAFTVAELGEMLPYKINPEETIGGWFFRIGRNTQGQHLASYKAQLPSNVTLQTEVADTEADARAKCLIYLLENGLIKA